MLPINEESPPAKNTAKIRENILNVVIRLISFLLSDLSLLVARSRFWRITEKRNIKNEGESLQATPSSFWKRRNRIAPAMSFSAPLWAKTP